eukprot:CAMPEP_0175040912 /NCGR_PEP_ID=MMETSP0052_2-20121109/1574_1 /TAXON_ID=51329 ORGANISM="Polytomella parva, Strain SAG 63-3" /NCGR_SAMPLE_ID=MMETSP0052_2 /ASSEMBLY_ACC=CAM_ASM_000194 /LENGTH=392 /DNA_ID=CAMNT_0016303271 /DNA_START=41 /DNA_END=1219 /DNA_ORIENTATION=-
MFRKILQTCCTSGSSILGSFKSASKDLVNASSICTPHQTEAFWSNGSGFSALQFVRTKYTYKFKQARAIPGLIYWKPRTSGLRHKITIDYDFLGVHTGPPHKDLSTPVKNLAGRNSTGRITSWHRGGGMKKVLRQVDFGRTDLDGLPGTVERIEKDPNRSGFLALVKYQRDFELPFYKYHLAPAEVKSGDVIVSGSGSPIQVGSSLPIRDIPIGMPIHNLELYPGKGGQIARSASTAAIVQSKQNENAIVKLPSGEIRLIDLNCRATIGRVSNHLQRFINYGKAGERRKLGWRPVVRGIAMNPVDHPHGGRTNGGRPSCTPWGVYCKGQRTRLRNKPSNRFIITRKGGQPIQKFANAKKVKAKTERDRKAANVANQPQAKSKRGPTIVYSST